MDNRWNRLIYKLWSPIYDKCFNTGRFLKARKKILQEVKFVENQNVLFVRVGTGADLELINYKKLNIIGIDYSNAMLKKARGKFKGSSIQFIQMDAQDMDFSDHYFDLVIGSLILSVVPDANNCLKEIVRVLKPNGEVIIFDKFTKKDKGLSLFKKGIRPFIKLLGTDIGVNFEKLCKENIEALSVKEDHSVMFNGIYRKIILRKMNA